MRLEELGLIGNCQYSALVDRAGAVVWCCLPRFDAEPVFGSLLDPENGGRFLIGPPGGGTGEQRYLDNTNILATTFRAPEGSFRILDFAPRFSLYDRYFRPTQLVRVLEPLDGAPLVRVVCDPRRGWSKARPEQVLGSHHVRFEGFASQLRLTTDVPLSYLGGAAFALTERKHMVLSWGAPVEEPLAPLCARFLRETAQHWRRWVKNCDTPAAYQAEVIRSALTLKLHCFEDTGAIVAATTTSLPESPGSGRTWDYRYCWLRDAYYALDAFRLLGHFEEREAFVHYLVNLAAGAPDLALSPLYAVDGGRGPDERVHEGWPGYESNRPVREGNAASVQPQHDIFGEMVLALTPVYFDERFSAERTPAVLDLLVRLARKAVALAGTPDAGIWEYRRDWRPQTFSSLMCWAGAERMARVAARTGHEAADEFQRAAARIQAEIVERCWNEELGAFTAANGGRDLDASVLQMAKLRFLAPQDPRLARTVSSIRRELGPGVWLRRYRADDGFGEPAVAFLLCTFWLVEALGAIGRKTEAQSVMDEVHAALPPLGLLSEDYDPVEKRLWGNFPQVYSHVGLIHAAFAAAPPWSEVL